MNADGPCSSGEVFSGFFCFFDEVHVRAAARFKAFEPRKDSRDPFTASLGEFGLRSSEAPNLFEARLFLSFGSKRVCFLAPCSTW